MRELTNLKMSQTENTWMVVLSGCVVKTISKNQLIARPHNRMFVSKMKRKKTKENKKLKTIVWVLMKQHDQFDPIYAESVSVCNEK